MSSYGGSPTILDFPLLFGYLSITIEHKTVLMLMITAAVISSANIAVIAAAMLQVLFCTFSSMILLMLATFSVVLNSGAIRLAGIE